MRAFISICLLVIILTFPGCETNLHGLPAQTSTGKNTVGCIVNGTTIYNVNTLDIEALWDTGPEHRLNIHAYFVDKSSLDISLYNSGMYAFQRIFDVNNKSDSVQYQSKDSCIYKVNSRVGNTFTLTITKFTDKIVSGTFSMNAMSVDCADLTITEGRFDSTIGSKDLGIW